MNHDLINILSHSNKDIDNQRLMDYLSGKLTDQEKHELEQAMADADNQFLNDAMEGLEMMNEGKNLELYVDQLHKNLHQQIQQKKQRREKRKIKDIPWTYLAVFLILLLIILAWVVIQQLSKG